MRRSLGTAAAAVGLVVLVGCSGPSGGDAGGSDSGAGGGAVVGESGGSPGAAADDADPDRQVVTTATTHLTVEDPAEGARRVSELVESVGGRVDERTEQAASSDDRVEGAYASLVVRVPADELTGVLTDLAELGEVANVSVSRSDVTSTAVDLDARIAALQTSVARLQSLMDGADSTEALLQAEKALSERQEELESLQSRRALLADQVELSTLSVHLSPFGVAPAGGPDGFLEGLGTGWRALVAAFGAGLVLVGIVLPWVAVAALVTAAVVVPLRRARRRGATPPPPEPAQPVQDQPSA